MLFGGEGEDEDSCKLFDRPFSTCSGPLDAADVFSAAGYPRYGGRAFAVPPTPRCVQAGNAGHARSAVPQFSPVSQLPRSSIIDIRSRIS